MSVGQCLLFLLQRGGVSCLSPLTSLRPKIKFGCPPFVPSDETFASNSFTSRARYYSTDGSEETDENLLALFDENDEKESLIPRSLRVGSSPQQVLIIHPHIKHGPHKRYDTTPKLELEEAVSLINTLKDWKVVLTKKVSLLSYDSHTFFNKGQLAEIVSLVKQNEYISGIFLNVKSLRLNQHLFLESTLGVPVFDRCAIVINIFKKHAVSKDAKLQVALAEIPYIRSRVKGVNESESGELIKNVGIASNNSYLSKRLTVLSFHEQKLKKSLAKLRKNRELLRSKRKSLQLPVVAVVGYTNAGKTSLIKCLTQEEKMQPEDKLFATLDVTVHAGTLPCNLKVLYVDTIGFISDIPTNFLEPFIATLEDALQADLIVHVQDVSHPNYLKQKAHVLNVLKRINLPDNMIENIISVANKCDKLSKSLDDDAVMVSCKNLTGFEELEMNIENALVKTLGLQRLKIKVKNGGREYQWLHKEAAICDYIFNENEGEHVTLSVTISQAKLEQFKHYFIMRKHEL